MGGTEFISLPKAFGGHGGMLSKMFHMAEIFLVTLINGWFYVSYARNSKKYDFHYKISGLHVFVKSSYCIIPHK